MELITVYEVPVQSQAQPGAAHCNRGDPQGKTRWGGLAGAMQMKSSVSGRASSSGCLGWKDVARLALHTDLGQGTRLPATHKGPLLRWLAEGQGIISVTTWSWPGEL